LKEKTRAPTHEREIEKRQTDRQTDGERMASATIWKQEEIDSLKADYRELKQVQNDAVTQYNPTPGTGRTGYMAIPPNNYPFYNKEEKYVPVVQPDGGQLSDWKPLYQPSKEQEEEDRKKAYESGVPHGYVPRGFKYEGMPTIKINVTSELVRLERRTNKASHCVSVCLFVEWSLQRNAATNVRALVFCHSTRAMNMAPR
jgi:hypothetical protein